MQIEFHADDYALFPTQSQRILDCRKHGILNGVSIMTNSPHLAECMEQLRPHRKDTAVAVHLNFMEGKSLCSHAEVPLLTDPDGIFRLTFGKLLLASILPGKAAAYRTQLKQELRAQLHALDLYRGGAPLRIDGHAHYHMLPLVFDALVEVLREDALPVSYIRMPREYPSLYLRHRNMLREIAPINLVKVLILNLLVWRNRQKHRAFLHPLEQRVFLGVFLSGRMFYENVAAILPDAERLAARLGQGIEVLAHPGGVYEDADVKHLTHPDDVTFLTSDLRTREAGLFLRLRKEHP